MRSSRFDEYLSSFSISSLPPFLSNEGRWFDELMKSLFIDKEPSVTGKVTIEQQLTSHSGSTLLQILLHILPVVVFDPSSVVENRVAFLPN